MFTRITGNNPCRIPHYDCIIRNILCNYRIRSHHHIIADRCANQLGACSKKHIITDYHFDRLSSDTTNGNPLHDSAVFSNHDTRINDDATKMTEHQSRPDVGLQRELYSCFILIMPMYHLYDEVEYAPQ